MKQISTVLGILGGLMAGGVGVAWLITNEFSVLYQVIGFAGIALIFFYIYAHIDELIESFGSRSTRYSLFALLLTALCLVILGLVNFIAYRHPARYDATAEKVFSLSPQTVQLVQGLKEPVKVTFFTTGTVDENKFRDLLENYRAHSDKLEVTYIDPISDPAMARQMAASQQSPIVVTKGNNVRRISEMTEEALTNAIISVTREAQKKLCFLEGHGEKSITSSQPDGMSEARAALEKQAFTVSTLEMYKTNAIPEDCSTLVVAGPTRALFDSEKELISGWVQKGGRLVLMVDPVTPEPLAEYAATFGVKLHNDLVLDPAGQQFARSFAVPVALPVGYHDITRELQGVLIFMPITRSLEKIDPVPNNGMVDYLLQTTTGEAWGETDLSVLTAPPGTEVAPPEPGEQDIKPPLYLGALVTFPNAEAGAEGEAKEGEKKKRTGMVAVFGDSDFASNAAFNTSANGDLFMNTLSFLSEEEDLIAIRPKDKSKQTLSLSQAQGGLIFYSSILLVPAIPLLLGIYIFLQKRNL